MSKKFKIKILQDCRVDGQSLQRGKVYSVSEDGAKLACGARRAVYTDLPVAGKKGANKGNKDESSASEDEASTQDKE